MAPFTSGTVLAHVNDDTSYAFTDQEPIGGPQCSPEELNGDVEVTVYTHQDSATVPDPTPMGPGVPFAIGTIPARYWCANGAAVDFNGGCP